MNDRKHFITAFGCIAAVALVVAVALPVRGELISTSPSDFSVYAGGGISFDWGVTVESGMVGAGGDAWFGRNVNVADNVYTQGAFGMDRDTIVGGNIVAGGNTSFGRGATAGDVHTSGNVWMDRNGSLGSVNATGDVSLQRDASVGGNVDYNGTYWADRGVSVIGDVSRGTANPDTWSSTLRDRPDFTIGSQNLWYSNNSTITLDTGDYRDISTGNNVTLTLTAGTYNLSSLYLGQNSQIVADTSEGDVVINVANDFSSGQHVMLDNAADGSLVIVAGGDIYMGKDTTVEGSILSFGDDLGIDQSSNITGILYAEGDLWLGAEVNVQGMGFGGLGGGDVDLGGQGGAPVPEPASIALVLMGLPMVLRKGRLGRLFK